MKVAIGKQCGALIKDDALMEDSEKLYIVEFVFDESWEGFSKTAVFAAGDVTVEVALAEDRCIIPAQCLKKAGVYLRIGVSGILGEETKPTVWCLTSKILHKYDISDITPPTPVVPEEIRAQVVEVIKTSTATNEEIGDVLDEVFGEDGEQEGPYDPDDPTGSNTATDEEIGDLLDDVFGS